MNSEKISEIRCARCKYNLHGLDDKDNCPECGLHVALSRVFAKRPRLLKKEDVIVDREASYKRARFGTAVLLGFALAAPIMMIFTMNQLPVRENGESFSTMMLLFSQSVWFVALLSYVAHARAQHAESIRLYREYLGAPYGRNRGK